MRKIVHRYCQYHIGPEKIERLYSNVSDLLLEFAISYWNYKISDRLSLIGIDILGFVIREYDLGLLFKILRFGLGMEILDFEIMSSEFEVRITWDLKTKDFAKIIFRSGFWMSLSHFNLQPFT